MKMFSNFCIISITLALISYVYGYSKIDDKYLMGCNKSQTKAKEYNNVFLITDEHYNGTDLFLMFYIKSARYASILLSSGHRINPSEVDAYEVILASSSEIPSQIRTLKEHDILAKRFANDTVSPNEWRPFWIRISSNGLVEVGKEMGSSAFLSWQKKPMPVSHFAFSNYNDKKVNWAFHCPNNTDASLTGCTKKESTKYLYTVAYPIDEYIQEGNIFFFPFYVKTERDAHIIFTSTSKPAGYFDLAYEIVLGCCNNTGANIRSVRHDISKVEYWEENMLSPDKWLPFWIRISPNGLVEVGKEIGSDPIMSWNGGTITVRSYSVGSFDYDVVNYAVECPSRLPRLSSHISNTSIFYFPK